MKTKRYWLRGGLVGLVVGLIIQIVFFINTQGVEYAIAGFFHPFAIPLNIAVIGGCIIIGCILGFLYSKSSLAK